MKPRNLILQSAIAMAFGVGATTAMAGSVGTVPETFASEGNPGANPIQSPDLNYQWGATIAPNVDLNLKITLGNGATWDTAPAAASMTCDAQVASTVTVSTDKTSVTYLINSGPAGFLATVSSCILAPTGKIAAPSLATPAGKVEATWRNFAANSGAEVDAGDGPGGTHTTEIANSVAAITGKITSSGAFTPAAAAPTKETAVIDLTGNNSLIFTTPGAALSNQNSPTSITLGSVTYTDTPGTQNDGLGADYTLAAKVASIKGTVTGVFQAASLMNLGTTATCAAQIPAGGAGALNAANTVFTFTGATTPATGAPWFFCYVVNGTAVIPTTTPTADFVTVPTVANNIPDAATGALYALVTNGATVDIISYIPAATVGYVGFTRVVNCGNTATPITGTIINPNGSLGATGTIIANLEVGGSRTLTSTEVESGLTGTKPTGNERPRLRVNGSTSCLDAQTFMSNPGGVVTNNSSIEKNPR